MAEIVVVLTMATMEFLLDLQTVEDQIVDQAFTALDLDQDLTVVIMDLEILGQTLGLDL